MDTAKSDSSTPSIGVYHFSTFAGWLAHVGHGDMHHHVLIGSEGLLVHGDRDDHIRLRRGPATSGRLSRMSTRTRTKANTGDLRLRMMGSS